MSKVQLNIRLPEALLSAARETATARGQTLTELIEGLLYSDIGLYSDLPSEPICSRVARLEARVEQLENYKSHVPIAQDIQKPAKPAIQRIASDSSLLTTSEAFAELKRRGWQGETTTLRRKLRGGAVPADLARFGLLIDSAGLEQRRQTPKDNRVKWLFFEQ